MTYNVRGPWDRGQNAWENRRQMVIDLIAEEAPILFGTQEGDASQLDEISSKLPQYGRIGVGRDDGALRGEQCAIFFEREYFDLLESGTFWLSEAPDEPNSMSWDTACTRISTFAKFLLKGFSESIWVFNCHLDHVSEEARQRGMELILRRLNKSRPCVLMGDLNAAEHSEPVLTAGKVLIETFRRVSDEVDVCTYTDFDPSRITGDKIDYIFCSEDLKVLDAQVVRKTYGGRQPSDHFPVTATLGLTLGI